MAGKNRPPRPLRRDATRVTRPAQELRPIDQCGSRYSVRWKDAPTDQWDISACRRPYGHAGVHFDGGVTYWGEVPEPPSDTAVLRWGRRSSKLTNGTRSHRVTS